MTICSYCRAPYDHIPFRCKYCGMTYCINCHLRENHNCSSLKKKVNIFERLKGVSIKGKSGWPYAPRKETKTIVGLILSPFVWIFGVVGYLLNLFIVSPMIYVYEEARNFLYHFTKGVRHISSAIFALLKIVLFLALCYFVITFIWNSEILSKSVETLKEARLPIPFAKNCSAKLNSGDCSTNKPFYCDDGKLVKRADICGCDLTYRVYGQDCIQKITCQDGTLSPDCSKNKPYQCIRGNLVPNSTFCGCPEDYLTDGDGCKKIQRCLDGTIYKQCSNDKPKFCENGSLIDRASVCGCGGDLTASGDRCVSRYETNAKSLSYPYVLRGSRGNIPVTVFGGLKNYLARQPRTFVCYGGVCPSDSEMQLSFVKEPIEKPYIYSLANQIMGITQNRDDQARIAVSLVQQMPYDWIAFNSNSVKGRYPYETLYDNTGVCEEKSTLLVSLLRDMGFGTALFNFNTQNHMAVGIKCPDQYAYKGTGYCFIEATSPTIITFSNGDYISVGKLTTQPVVILVSDGISFASVSEEYADANRYSQITSMGPVLDMSTYNEWLTLSNKYGMSTNPSSASENNGIPATSNPSNNNRVIESSGTSDVCGHEGERCCAMLISGESSATFYEVCEDKLTCVNSRCVRN